MVAHANATAATSLADVVDGHSQGNHELNCTIIRPCAANSGPTPPAGGYPVIGWGNGWGQGEIFGDNQTAAYLPGLIEWAETGDYLVVAANQWSARAPDVLRCVQWLVDQNVTNDSAYEGVVNATKIGLAGHSQGGGAALKAGDGGPGGLNITTVIAMNPYGPSFVKAFEQNGPVMLLGGPLDTVTPTESYSEMLDVILNNQHGGLQAELILGTHGDPAFAPQGQGQNAHLFNFGEFQNISLWWWQIYLSGDTGKCAMLSNELVEVAVWNTIYSNNFVCPH
jgi:dienelactone hydrolase